MNTFYLVGPTGSGKSSIALSLADLVGGEIVNADAFQLYSGLSVLTARPSTEDEERVPHHLYGVLNPNEVCHAGRYLEMAEVSLEEIHARGKTAIVVGGSGLYVKALTHGLNDMPETDPEIRESLDRLSLEELHAKLVELDPVSSAAIEPNNRRYVQRAIEISLSSGLPASELRKAWESDSQDLRGVTIAREREILYRRIDERTIEMFAAGAVEEVASIPHFSETAEKAIGVNQIRSLLQGETDKEACIAEIQKASRRYAKRQLTWFRREKWLFEWNVDSFNRSHDVALRIQKEFF
tara:strand:+ start:8581 stop:9468 length:888 start_codon:yes stop_codon:yes gene_type:complete